MNIADITITHNTTTQQLLMIIYIYISAININTADKFITVE